MNTLFHLNNWLYHSAEILLCDLRIAFYEYRMRRLDLRIQKYEAMLRRA